MSASVNQFTEVVKKLASPKIYLRRQGLLRSPPPKMEAIFGGEHLMRPTCVNMVEAQRDRLICTTYFSLLGLYI
jgi:hypothetical protein